MQVTDGIIEDDEDEGSSGSKAQEIGGLMMHLNRKFSDGKRRPALSRKLKRGDSKDIVGQMIQWISMKRRQLMRHLKAKMMKAIHQR